MGVICKSIDSLKQPLHTHLDVLRQYHVPYRIRWNGNAWVIRVEYPDHWAGEEVEGICL